ncbi:hypothetical protein D3C79_1077580 [compost metagenome]
MKQGRDAFSDHKTDLSDIVNNQLIAFFCSLNECVIFVAHGFDERTVDRVFSLLDGYLRLLYGRF